MNFDIKPDITAYGRHVISTIAAEPFGYPPGTYLFAIGSGTSFSTPMISGLVALIKQAHPDWTPEMIRSALISTAMIDLDESSVTDPYVMNPYIQGGGIPNITAAITTPFLPMPAKVSFGLVDPNGTGVTVWRTVDLIALSPSVSTATVLSVELYDVYGNDYSSWITSPSVGDTFTLNSTLNLSISVPATAPGDRLYWGRILLDVNPTYQVIFGFYVPTKYWLNGTVYDVSTFDPVPGALVMAVSPDLSTVYNSTYTDASGQFSMQVYSGLDVRVEVSMPGYYEYYSFPFTMDGDVVWNAYITPIVGYDPLNMLVVWDNVYGFWTGDPYTTNIGDVLSLDGTLGVTMFLWDNDLQQVAADAILSGDFPVVGMFSGGVWYPFADILDAIALWYYALYYDGGILLEGGDIGWFWSGTPIMTDVAHAEFVGDLWPSTYTIEVTRDHAVTRFLPSTTIDIDSSGEGWPDAVVPVNGGVDVANWSFGYSAIVTYDSRPDGISTGESRTVYYAFPWDSILDSTTKYTLLNYTILWLFDRGPPVYTGTNVTVDIDVAAGTAVARWDPFADEPFGIVTFNVYLNGTLLASGLTGNSFDLTPYVAPGERYIVTVEAVDVVGDSTNISAWFYMIPPGTTGASFGFVENGVFTDTAPVGPAGTTFTIEVTNAPVSIQILELSDIPAADGLPTAPIFMIFDTAIINASGVGWLQMVVSYPDPPERYSEDIRLYWYNGAEWVEASNYVVDPDTNTITVWIDSTTSPTLDELTGTPFVLYYTPSPVVGGEAEIAVSGAPALLVLAGVVLLGAALAVAYRRRA